MSDSAVDVTEARLERRTRAVAEAKARSQRELTARDGGPDAVSRQIVHCTDGVAWWAVNRITGNHAAGFVRDEEV